MIGSSIAHYRITAKIGQGGMGEVYQATDDRLNRDVAIKLLPESVENDPARLARFRREAQVLAALTHGNIAAVYGLEEQEGRSAIVLELVEGETLAERIARGALPVEDAREIAQQIAEALEAAHEKGIVHRDLKPANVKITPDGTVKVLDFGLAKALEPESSEQDISTSPTLTAAATQAGVILGTAAYMAPEQAKGKPVDRRADVWAFGCVLYEMLTGRAPFAGDGVSEVLAHVITQEPDFQALPRTLPAQLDDTIRRCLRKDPRMRLPDIAAARIALQEAAEAPETADASEERRAAWTPGVLLMGALALVLGLALVWALIGKTTMTTRPTATHFDLVLDPEPLGVTMALSHDGSALVYSGSVGGENQLYLRRLNGNASEPIPGTERGYAPFFSPDDRHIGFFAAGRVKRVSLSGGMPEPLSVASGDVTGAVWTADDEILFTTGSMGVPHRVSAQGGEPSPVQVNDLGSKAELHGSQMLPDGRTLLLTMTDPSLDGPRIVALDLDDGSLKIVARGTDPLFAPPDRLLYLQQGRPIVADLDVARREVVGEERSAPLVDPALATVHGFERFFASIGEAGTLVYASGNLSEQQDVLRVENGVEEPLNLKGRVAQVDASGRWAVAQDIKNDIVLLDLDGGVATPLTFLGSSVYPFWSHDSKRVIFADQRGGDWAVYSIAPDGRGEAELLFDEFTPMLGNSAGPDGTLMGYRIHPETNRDIWIASPDGKLELLLATKANERAGMISPDGRRFAYVSDEEGPDEVYIRTLPVTDRRWRVSTGGGGSPVWSRDGRQLFFLSRDTIMVADVSTEGAMRLGSVREVYTHERLDWDFWGNKSFDLLPHGGFLVSVNEPSEVRLRVVLAWGLGDE